MSKITKVYFSGIEEKIVEELNSSTKRIYIAMAWLTSDTIKRALLFIALNKSIELKILIDDNKVNEDYFFGNNEYEIIYRKTKKYNRKFLHHKIIIIDNQRTITGSYNLSKKAKNNDENIVIISSKKLNDYYTRVFNFLYHENYIDKNIILLFQHKEFARNILSTYYNFSKSEYNKYKDKIEIGQCYSYFNGYFDIPKYYPGLIFNKSIRHKNINKLDMFHENYISTEIADLPISKESLREWVKSYQISNIIDSYAGHEHLYHLINDEVNTAELSIENYFTRKIDHCFSVSKIEKLIKNGVDIIAEDELWKINFEPFLNKETIAFIFEKLDSKKTTEEYKSN